LKFTPKKTKQFSLDTNIWTFFLSRPTNIAFYRLLETLLSTWKWKTQQITIFIRMSFLILREVTLILRNKLNKLTINAKTKVFILTIISKVNRKRMDKAKKVLEALWKSK